MKESRWSLGGSLGDTHLISSGVAAGGGDAGHEFLLQRGRGWVKGNRDVWGPASLSLRRGRRQNGHGASRKDAKPPRRAVGSGKADGNPGSLRVRRASGTAAGAGVR